MMIFLPILLIIQRRAVSQQSQVQGVPGCVIGKGLCLCLFVAVKIRMFIGRTVKIFLGIRLYSTKIIRVECKERTCFFGMKGGCVDRILQGSLAQLFILLLALTSGVVPKEEVNIDRLVTPFIVFRVGHYAELDTKVINLLLIMLSYSLCGQSLDLVPSSALFVEGLVNIGPNCIEFFVAIEAKILPAGVDGS